MIVNPWRYIGYAVLVVAALVLLLALIVSLTLAVSVRSYGRKTLRRFHRELEPLLPGTDCGECGCESCAAYGEAVLYEQLSADLCSHGGEGLSRELAVCADRYRKLLTYDGQEPAKTKKANRKKNTKEM